MMQSFDQYEISDVINDILIENNEPPQWGRSEGEPESEAEYMMLHTLRKYYEEWAISIQHKLGRYRADFLVYDGTMIEVDGKQWHDQERDYKRDSWILQNCETVRRIIRVPGSLMFYFPEQVCGAIEEMAGLRRMYSAVNQFSHGCDWINEVSYHGDSYTANEYAFQKGYFLIFRSVAKVGYLGAFLDHEHDLFLFVDRSKKALCRWSDFVLCRTRND